MGYLNIVYKVHRLYDALEVITAFVLGFCLHLNINWTDKLVSAAFSLSVALIGALLVDVLKRLNVPEAIIKILKRKKK